MAERKNKSSKGGPVGLMLLGLVGLGLLITMLLQGVDVTLLNPKGLIAGEQRNLMLFTAAVLLVIAVPTLTLLYFFAWKYRESNTKATYSPDARHGKVFVFSAWAVPTVFAIVLASVMWPATHRLEPRKSIAANAKPLTIQVVAMRWKWLFIYPEQHIATVNFVQVPVNTPVQFELTADEAPMSSFWIPHLGGQLYAMTGHANLLHLMAETPGDYPGSSAEINGAGFAGMKFIARASSQEQFDFWLQDVRLSSDVLDASSYKDLLKPSENNPAARYTLDDADLYDTVLKKYMGSHDHSHTEGTSENHQHAEHE
jgi:cytochrome o ubiquinol oxidase subunit 2